jgi:hypothetical protein
VRRRAGGALRALWSWLRAVSGDSAYESCVRRARRAGHAPPSREAFYLDTLRRRYSTINRCC